MAEKNEILFQDLVSEIEEAKNLVNDPDLKDALLDAKNTVKKNLGIDIPEEILITIGSLFILDDEKFVIISDGFINALEKNLSRPAEKISLCQSLNISNVKLEDLIQIEQAWNIQIDKLVNDNFSQVKKDFLKRVFSTVINAAMDSQGLSKRIINIPIETENGAEIPKYAKDGDAGVDIYAMEDVELKPGEIKIVRTGIKIQIPRGYEIQVRPRSGLSANSKLRIANAPGTIDSGYRDEIGIICENIASPIEDLTFHYDDLGHPVIDSIVTGRSITIEKGQRIAQLVLSEVPTIYFTPVEKISSEENRGGGFGSTGI